MKNYIKDALKIVIGDKERYNAYKKQKALLPATYKQAVDALEKYMWNFARGDGFMVVMEHLLHLFEESALDSLPVSSIIGDDPVAFATDLMNQYPEELWTTKSQEQLRKSFEGIEDK